MIDRNESSLTISEKCSRERSQGLLKFFRASIYRIGCIARSSLR